MSDASAGRGALIYSAAHSGNTEDLKELLQCPSVDGETRRLAEALSWRSPASEGHNEPAITGR